MIEAQADLEESREIRIKRLTMRSMRPVSYTHLTLPTSDLV